jgi:hypothetical protein
MLDFPAIDYQFWLEHWNSVIGSKFVYLSKSSRNYCSYTGSTADCGKRIETKINEIINLDLTNCKSGILEVIDLIYAWGGRSGRMFYFERNGTVPREHIESIEMFSLYVQGIRQAQTSDPDAFSTFQKIFGIGSSFASKHAYFWSKKSKNRLIIIDSKISGALGYATIGSFLNHHPYNHIIEQFTLKAGSEFNKPDGSLVEKALFAFHNNYFLNDNLGMRKGALQIRDIMEAKRLKDKLSIRE